MRLAERVGKLSDIFMFKPLQRSVAATVALLGIAIASYGQTSDQALDLANQKPKTKLESFLAKDGVVVVRGYSTIGTVAGLFGSSVTIDSKEFTEAASGQKQYGITVEVKRLVTTGVVREHTSYIDYDEIESLIAGLDYIAKLDNSVTKLSDFQGDYKTKDDLRLSTFSGGANLSSVFGNPDKKMIYFAVESGTIGSASATFKADALKQVRELIVKAREKIDSVKTN